jgi:hypothetical protein
MVRFIHLNLRWPENAKFNIWIQCSKGTRSELVVSVGVVIGNDDMHGENIDRGCKEPALKTSQHSDTG